MTAEEARCLTRAALLNFQIVENIDVDIKRAAKEGKYSGTFSFLKGGYYQELTPVEYDAIIKHYQDHGFKTERINNNGSTKFSKINISWEESTVNSKEKDTKYEDKLENNVD